MTIRVHPGDQSRAVIGAKFHTVVAGIQELPQRVAHCGACPSDRAPFVVAGIHVVTEARLGMTDKGVVGVRGGQIEIGMARCTLGRETLLSVAFVVGRFERHGVAENLDVPAVVEIELFEEPPDGQFAGR